MIKYLYTLCLSLLSPLLLSGCFVVNIPLGLGTSEYKPVELDSGGDKTILVLDIDGTITSGTTSGDSLTGFDTSTVNEVTRKLALAEKDDNIVGVILRIDSPGGGVTASDIVYEEIRKFKEETKVPIYACFLNVAASGGYYIAMAADEIYAHPTTITGSVGVVATFPQVNELGNKIGMSVKTIKSGELKDMGSPFKKMGEEEEAVFQNLVNEMYVRFVNIIESGRENLDRNTIMKLADGRIYTADQAKENGLIDDIMYMEQVVEKMRTDTNEDDARVVLYRRTSTENIPSFYAKATNPASANKQGSSGTELNLLKVGGSSILGANQPFLQYIWIP